MGVGLGGESWREVQRRLAADPSSPLGGLRRETPHVRAPECPRDCSGRHDTDSVLACPVCGPVYRIVHHEYLVSPGIHFTEVRPLEGAPAWEKDRPCPACGRGLERR